MGKTADFTKGVRIFITRKVTT